MREAKCIKVNICRHLHLLHHIIEASRVLLKISSDFREMFHQNLRISSDCRNVSSEFRDLNI